MSPRSLCFPLLLLSLGCSSATNAAGPSSPPETASSADSPPPADSPPAGSENEPSASATLQSNAGVEGTVRFAPDGDAVVVTVSLTGLEPGPHGFHIHETGDCSAEDFTSAGGHFNPHQDPHGAPSDAQHHTGDFGNVEASADGVVSTELQMQLTLDPAAADSVIGKAVIVHAQADDLKSQPSGAAGPRVACGVISP